MASEGKDVQAGSENKSKGPATPSEHTPPLAHRLCLFTHPSVTLLWWTRMQTDHLLNRRARRLTNGF